MRNSRGKSHGDHEDGSRTDLRVIKTKRAITGTLIELLRTKSIGKITVTELAQKAEINKGTFTSITRISTICTRKLCKGISKK